MIALSSTVRCENRLVVWNVRAIPRRAIACIGIVVTSAPSNVSPPDVAGK